MTRTSEILAQLREDKKPTVLLNGGTVITMDPAVPDLLKGDVLIEGGKIKAVGPDLSEAAADGQAVVVDATGMVVSPGFCDGHRHCWQNQFRRILCDVNSLDTYMSSTHGGISLHYRPEDIYIGNVVSMIGAIDSGVTTVLDFSHNSRSPEHSDAAFRAYRDVGSRVVHASAPPNEGEWGEQWPSDIARLDSEHGDSNPLVTVRMGIDMSARWGATPELLAKAREMDVEISIDGVCLGKLSSEEVEVLGRTGSLGPDVSLIHCTDLSDEAWRWIKEAGCGVTLAVTSDEQIGIAGGDPPIQKALDMGIRPSMSVDVEIALASDMFSQMRAVLTTQRMQVAQLRYRGSAAPNMLTVRDVLEFATINGARHMGVGDVVGSITPGKEADVLLVSAEAANNFPLNNAVGTLVLGADNGNVRAVFVGGEVRKWDGEIVWLSGDLDQFRSLAIASRDRIMEEAEFELAPLADGVGYPQGSPLGNLGPIIETPS
jgi:cytosine/adenosine deaminase-related metal-dependent hydrolase